MNRVSRSARLTQEMEGGARALAFEPVAEVRQLRNAVTPGDAADETIGDGPGGRAGVLNVDRARIEGATNQATCIVGLLLAAFVAR